MKLLIDVDEELVCKGFEQPLTEEERNILIRAIGNGTPYEERPTGKWIKDGCGHAFCDKCDYEEASEDCRAYNYCPHCGVKMRGEE